jgi:ketosteroid isomerase-like protein
MVDTNKAILEKANDAILKGDNEGFLSFCTDDTKWNFVGDKTLRGKQAVREWMEIDYKEPPRFKVANLIGGDDFVIALGDIVAKDEKGEEVWHKYCDVWRFREGKMTGLKAFVIKPADGE